jgi:hypothetical protein
MSRASIHQYSMRDWNVNFSIQILIFDSMRPKSLFTNVPEHQVGGNSSWLIFSIKIGEYKKFPPRMRRSLISVREYWVLLFVGEYQWNWGLKYRHLQKSSFYPLFQSIGEYQLRVQTVRVRMMNLFEYWSSQMIFSYWWDLEQSWVVGPGLFFQRYSKSNTNHHRLQTLINPRVADCFFDNKKKRAKDWPIKYRERIKMFQDILY